MLKKKTIEEYIIKILVKDSLSTVLLLSEINKIISCTKQGFYKALRNLKEEEVVVIHAKKVSLSYVWIKKQSDFYNSAIYKLTNKKTFNENFLLLEKGDSVTYKFNNASVADAFWIHTLSILNQQIDKNEPMCIYNPHEWFLLARNESEKSLFKSIKEMKRKLVVLVDNKMPLDNSVRKYFDFKASFYYIAEKRIFKKNNYYLNIIGDYCIEVWIDKKTSNLIDDFYKQNDELTEQSKEILLNIIKTRGKNKFVISKDSKRSSKFKKIFKKFFLF